MWAMMFMSRSGAHLFSRLFHSPSVQLEVMDVVNVDLHFSDISDAEINEETSRRFTKPVTEVNNYIILVVLYTLVS